MSKFTKKYNVKIKAKLGKYETNLTVPVSICQLDLITQAAIDEAEFQGLTDVEVLSVSDVEPEYEQLELPFDYSEPEAASASYTSYASVASDNQDSQGPGVPAEDQQFDEETSRYKSYSSVKAERDVAESLPPTFTPRINNNYTPYKTRVVSVDKTYKDFDFR